MSNDNIDFERIVDLFNTNGKKAAMEFTQSEYNIPYAYLQRKIKEETNYFFNRRSRKYEFKTDNSPFMSLDELYQDKAKTSSISKEDRSLVDLDPHLENNIFKDIVVGLMKDKIQEINKYVHIEQSTKLAFINLKKLEENGYKVIVD